MTRINLIPPEELTDKHLIAEYRELPRVFRLARSPQPNEAFKWPKQYTLGKGHVKFFYDKLEFLAVRFTSLVREMERRGFKPQYKSPPIDPNLCGSYLWNNYEPTAEALELNRLRIRERLNK